MNPQGSGSSASVSQAVDPEIRSRAEDLIARTGWRGLFMIELLRDDSGKPWFIEFNGLGRGEAWRSLAGRAWNIRRGRCGLFLVRKLRVK